MAGEAMSSSVSGPRQIHAVVRGARADSASAARPARGVSLLLTLGLLLACALVLTLAWQLRELRQERRGLIERVNDPYVGMYVPKVALTALDGSAVVLGEPRADYQLLYFFSTTCPHCLASLPMVKAIAAQVPAASKGRAEIIGVASASAADAGAYARAHALAFPIVANSEVRTAMLFRAHSVPLLLVIDADGRVRHARMGVIDEAADLRAVLAALDPPKRSGGGAARIANKESP